MVELDSPRFADTRVGQPLPAAPASRLGATRQWPTLAESYVQQWAGRGARIAQHSSTSPEPAADEVDELIGSIYARHLDDSQHVDVRVVGHTRSGARLIDIVRVQLR
jgi:hypothetical protein